MEPLSPPPVEPVSPPVVPLSPPPGPPAAWSMSRLTPKAWPGVSPTWGMEMRTSPEHLTLQPHFWARSRVRVCGGAGGAARESAAHHGRGCAGGGAAHPCGQSAGWHARGAGRHRPGVGAVPLGGRVACRDSCRYPARTRPRPCPEPHACLILWLRNDPLAAAVAGGSLSGQGLSQGRAALGVARGQGAAAKAPSGGAQRLLAAAQAVCLQHAAVAAAAAAGVAGLGAGGPAAGAGGVGEAEVAVEALVPGPAAVGGALQAAGVGRRVGLKWSGQARDAGVAGGCIRREGRGGTAGQLPAHAALATHRQRPPEPGL